MTTSDFSTTILVDQTPEKAFDAIKNVRGWWSEEVTGGKSKQDDIFNYHYKDVHKCEMKLIEIIPDKKVVWIVLNNYFNFTKDNSEWNGTKIIFEITEEDSKTRIRFTHQGLVPAYECFDICSVAWTRYIQESLYSLITTGKGQPNAKEADLNFTATLVVDQAPEQVFQAVNNVKGWWNAEMKGNSEHLNDEFEVLFFDGVHYSKQRLTEVIPNKKVAWLVTDSKLNFLKNESEWTDTKIVFESLF